MRKQYINSSNRSPSMLLGTPWLMALTVYVFNGPTWLYGVIGTITVLMVVSFFYRTATEDGVDVVRRSD